MRKFSFKSLMAFGAAAAALLPSTQAHALLSPLGIAILAPVQFPPTSFSVVGARASVFWGHHRDVFGFDLGAVGNITDVNFVGIGVSGIFNYNKGVSTIVGLQAAGITNVNINKSTIVGLQFAGITNQNMAETTVVGLQLSPYNSSAFSKIWGIQAGVYNVARVVNGFQIGLVNMTESLHGLQIGLANFNKTGIFSFSPFLNVGF